MTSPTSTSERGFWQAALATVQITVETDRGESPFGWSDLPKPTRETRRAARRAARRSR
ncbi:hypothetical protein OG481_02000 [Streptomyces longwoodensis]|uniref:hypothetical protein n=1 Tax=Streptomyces longwoodensis TaxID=68231 RepID=UPI002DD7BB37|nr:hypothetical protein [Streptomyces longwoodensis]WRY87365.1 hypothetical protein OG481_02000 [Streptomyces longwoodensis]